MSTEQWRDIPGMVGFYQASSLGRIRSVPRTRRGKGKSVRPCPGVVLSLFNYGKPPYLSFRSSTGDSVKTLRAHRCVAMAFVPNPENKPCVNHKDSNPFNNEASNLEWVTHRENCIHASRAGRLPTGSAHHSKTKPWLVRKGSAVTQSILNEASVVNMRSRHEQGETKAALAKEHGVSQVTAGRAINRKTWRHVA